MTQSHPITVNGRKPTHYCASCGALWWEQPDAWSLVSLHCGNCCDNAPMGEQIKPLPTTSQLGATYVDKITSFRGVAIGHCEYLTGCNQTLLQPEGKDPAVRPQSEWFDDQRLDAVKAPVVVLDNSRTPGCDRQAPRR